MICRVACRLYTGSRPRVYVWFLLAKVGDDLGFRTQPGIGRSSGDTELDWEGLPRGRSDVVMAWQMPWRVKWVSVTVLDHDGLMLTKQQFV